MAKILFDGDSITDCYRTQKFVENDFYSKEDNLGFGFVSMLKSMMKVLVNEEHIIKNNGVAGDTTSSLLKRIDESIKFEPDYLILLIGINDCFNKKKTKQTTDSLDFENNYKLILSKMTEKNPNLKIILQTITYYEDDENKILVNEVIEKNEIIKKIAQEFNCMIVDSYQLINKKIKETKLIDWLYEDNLHYTCNTHMYIADKILPYLI